MQWFDVLKAYYSVIFKVLVLTPGFVFLYTSGVDLTKETNGKATFLPLLVGLKVFRVKVVTQSFVLICSF